MSKKSLNKPIFISGCHKSGTSLLRSLLDGHPDLFVIPVETHIFQYANHWLDYRLRRARPKNLTLSEIKDNYIQIMQEMNEKTTRVADADVTGKVDIPVFINEIDKADNDFQDLVVHYFYAIHKSLTGKDLPSNVRITEKTVENAEVAAYLKQMFPEAKFVHILRNPYSNLVSLRKTEVYRGRRSYPFLHPILETLENSYYYMYRNSELLRDDYLVVRYEDLLNTPEDTMRKISQHIDLDYSEDMLNPTALGEKWSGNSSRGLSFSGINKENAERWKKDINHLEVFFVTKYFSFLLRDYDYEIIQSNKSFRRPVRGEGVRVYLGNRFIPYYFR